MFNFKLFASKTASTSSKSTPATKAVDVVWNEEVAAAFEQQPPAPVLSPAEEAINLALQKLADKKAEAQKWAEAKVKLEQQREAEKASHQNELAKQAHLRHLMKEAGEAVLEADNLLKGRKQEFEEALASSLEEVEKEASHLAASKADTDQSAQDFTKWLNSI
jgi:uncharacterized protein YabN with tetrapyrrole methylase and pyrophosphatase domain